jgi:hypothetical protein
MWHDGNPYHTVRSDPGTVALLCDALELIAGDMGERKTGKMVFKLNG